MYPSEKNTNHLTVRGGGGGVNPYGQPDRKISAFFFDDFPKGSRQKKNGYFTVRLTVRVDPPPPPYGQLFCDFFGGVHLTLVYDYT